MDEDVRQTRDELMILEALVRAMDRRDEVLQVIDDSGDLDEAIRRVGQLLGVGALGSRAVLDLQVKRFARDQRQPIASPSRAEELRSSLPIALNWSRAIARSCSSLPRPQLSAP
jgi:DNA gyrase/topoisomerase IV subunit A